MLGCRCLNWGRVSGHPPWTPKFFSLPALLPEWPPGEGFATGKINIGELEVMEITNFEYVWGCRQRKGFSFYKPIGIPDGFFCLGYYSHCNQSPLHGFVLVAKEHGPELAALSKPADYVLVWCSDDRSQDRHELPGYFWLPQPPQGYKAMGFVVTNTSSKPAPDEVRCVRADLTDKCESYGLLVEINSTFLGVPLRVWRTRPFHRGMEAKGVCVGTFFCSTLIGGIGENQVFACLKNLDPCWPHAMPNLDQINTLITHYGPTIYFHPNEMYLPSSVSWFFESGALLYRKGDSTGQPIDPAGSNLPEGCLSDHEFWIDLPNDHESREKIKHGNLETAEVYAHIKPANGGTYTDTVMWLFFPFNGPATLKLGPLNMPLNGVGAHIGDWEHLTLRISNFSGRLHSIYLSQHASGEWVDPWELEFIQGNNAVCYSSKGGHANFPHPGTYLQGSPKAGVGMRNDCGVSDLYVDSSIRYKIVAAEYLGAGKVAEPRWLQYKREWGPFVVYDSRKELEKVLTRFPAVLRGLLDKLPMELYQEEGPTGPKEKNNWFQDERW